MGDLEDTDGNSFGGGKEGDWQSRCCDDCEEEDDDAHNHGGMDDEHDDEDDDNGNNDEDDKPGNDDNHDNNNGGDDEPNNELTHCFILNNKAAKNACFLTSMKTAFELTKQNNVEYGIVFVPTNNGEGYISGKQKGVDGQIFLNIKPLYINGIVHTHNKGQGSIYSYQDLAMLASIHLLQKIKKEEEFFFGLSTVDGDNAYMIMIENPEKFIYWVGWTFVGEKRANDLKNEFFEKYKIDHPTNYEKNEAEFIRYLNEAKTGLRLYKGKNADYTKWDRKVLDSNNKPVTENCY